MVSVVAATVVAMVDSPRVYGSARDLPSVKKIEQQMAAFKVLGFLLPKEQRKQLKDLQREHRRITEIVDRFYGLLGERNWVFTGDLNLPAIEHIISGRFGDSGGTPHRVLQDR